MNYMPHGYCFLWQRDLLALHIISDALIALAYFSIPVLLAIVARKRPDLPFAHVLWLFSLFIVSCGLTHVMSIIVIVYPLYWLEGVIKALTATASLTTAIILAGMIPLALTVLSSHEVDRLNERLQAALVSSERSRQRYEREHVIAQTLQHASLGEVPRRIGPLELSALYQPGVSDMEIGGDWFDAFQLPGGGVVVSIGDAAGKGLAASVIMAKMRQAIRITAQVKDSPIDVLDAADQALKLEHPDHFVTAFVGIIDVNKNTLTYAGAGHPPPLIRHVNGSIIELQCGGLPLGLREFDDQKVHHTIIFQRGALLVLFTDGLTESTHNFAEGDARLDHALRHLGVALAPNPAREISEIMLSDGIRDDVAVLTVRNGMTYQAGERWSFSIGDQESAYAVRHALISVLTDRGANAEETFAAELVFGELIGNVSRHASGQVDVRLDWHRGSPVLHVLDKGPGFDYSASKGANLESESGRGLFLAEHMTEQFEVRRRPGGGSHIRAELSFHKKLFSETL